MSNSLIKLNKAGQSIWFDNIERKMLKQNGTLAQLIIEDDLRGVTSNPAIFEKAIKGSPDYDTQLASIKAATPNINARDTFFKLAIKDIQDACDIMRPVYDKTHGQDGMISLEVSPDLAFDADGTIKEALILWKELNRPNAMIKVPATLAGIVAVKSLIEEGVNINVTLLFNVERYKAVANAYIEGLEARKNKGLSISGIESVASFFVSRIDAVLDPLLSECAPDLVGKVAIANAKIAYKAYLEIFNSARFAALKGDKTVRTQRLLWASTGVKNPKFSDVLYMEALIGKDTVNTVPPATYIAFKDHGSVALSLDQGMDAAAKILARLESLKIDFDQITNQLETEGLAQFEQAFVKLLASIENKLR